IPQSRRHAKRFLLEAPHPETPLLHQERLRRPHFPTPAPWSVADSTHQKEAAPPARSQRDFGALRRSARSTHRLPRSRRRLRLPLPAHPPGVLGAPADALPARLHPFDCPPPSPEQLTTGCTRKKLQKRSGRQRTPEGPKGS